MASRKAKARAEGGSSKKWMLTFSDMMTLLLTFFVLLVSMSSMDNQKLRSALRALQGALGVFEIGLMGSSKPVAVSTLPNPANIRGGVLKAAMQEMTQYISSHQLEDYVQVKPTERGMVVMVADNVLFESGSTKVKKSAYPLLHKIARLATRLAKTVRVEGNTDSTPVRSSLYSSNLELSARRAINVLNVILQEKVFTPYGASVGAFGEYNPIYRNERNEEQRRANRRVEIYIVDPPDVESFWYALMRSYLDNKDRTVGVKD